MTDNNPPTRYESNDLHISETIDILIQESSNNGNPLNLHDLGFDDCTIGMALSSHCSPRSEKMQRTVDTLITLLTKVCRQVSRRQSVMLEQGDLFCDH